jgi:hypothetical protein
MPSAGRIASREPDQPSPECGCPQTAGGGALCRPVLDRPLGKRSEYARQAVSSTGQKQGMSTGGTRVKNLVAIAVAASPLAVASGLVASATAPGPPRRIDVPSQRLEPPCSTNGVYNGTGC